MAASEEPIDRDFLALAEDLQRFAHGLLDVSRRGKGKGVGSDSGIIFTDKAKLGAFFAETQPALREELLQGIIQQIDELKMDPAKQAAAMVAIRKEKMDKSSSLVETLAAQRGALLATIIHKVVELKMDKVMHAAAILKENMGKAPVEVATAVGKIRKKKMDDKTPAKRGKVDAAPVMVATAMDTVLTDKCAESDPPAGVNGKHRLSDEYVGFILAMPRENPDDVVPWYDRCTTLAEVMGEEWLEEQKRVYKEGAARDRRDYDEFVQFQTWVLKEWLDKGYVEVDQEFIDNAKDLDDYSRERWEQHIKKRDPAIEFGERDDVVYDDFYVPFDPVEQARVLLSSLTESN